MTRDVSAAVNELIESRPAIHGDVDWGLGSDALRWLADHIEPTWRTIETGCGLSSILLMLMAAHHTIVGGGPWQHDAVRGWCAERGLATDNVTALAARSQDVLPGLPEEPIDLALVDGGHGFPQPIIDWWYLAERLKVGGFVLIDDTHLRAPGLLREFLEGEEGRWRLEAPLENAAVFVKLSDALLPADDWQGQPWSVAKPATGRGLLARLRGG